MVYRLLEKSTVIELCPVINYYRVRVFIFSNVLAYLFRHQSSLRWPNLVLATT